jgi:acyl dehydratase
VARWSWQPAPGGARHRRYCVRYPRLNCAKVGGAHNPAPLHLDEEYCREHTEFGQRIVNSAFTLGLMVGISVGETTLGTTVANLGWDEVRFPKPVFHGDTLRIETEVHGLRESRSRPNNGIVVFVHRAFNQRNELVASCKRSALMLRKPQ